MNQTAFRAGFFLINDCFDESHSCSQSIEGQGLYRYGDYWHAILHRREPDYGNSKYWFRHVGKHPVFAALAKSASEGITSLSGPPASRLQRWSSRLITSDGWDPSAFVDLCAAAVDDVELCEWCEQIQYEEMLLLLESNYQAVIAE